MNRLAPDEKVVSKFAQDIVGEGVYVFRGRPIDQHDGGLKPVISDR